MKSFKTLLKTEIMLSIRDMNMTIFAIIMPAVITIIIGMVYGKRPAFEGAEYSFMQQSFGALATIAICAGGVMGLPLVISYYRQRKILKRFKVTPISPSKLLIVQVVMYTLYAVASLLIVWAVMAIFFDFHFIGSIARFIVAYFMVLISMFSIGVMVGGVASNEKTAGIIASLLYFPMLIFSGTTLPYEAMPESLRKLADVLPLTHGIKLIKAATLGLPMDGVWFSTAITLSIAVVCIFVSLRFFRWE